MRIATFIAAIAMSALLAACNEEGEGAGEGDDAAEHSAGGEDGDGEDEDDGDDRAIRVLFSASGPVRPSLRWLSMPRNARTA